MQSTNQRSSFSLHRERERRRSSLAKPLPIFPHPINHYDMASVNDDKKSWKGRSCTVLSYKQWRYWKGAAA